MLHTPDSDSRFVTFFGLCLGDLFGFLGGVSLFFTGVTFHSLEAMLMHRFLFQLS